MSVKITADSTCDLSKEWIERYEIEIAPLCVVLDGKAYLDGIEITPDEVFAEAEKRGKIGSTAAVNVEDYRALFKKHLQDHEGLVHFTISSDMSSCYQNACVAAAEFENVFVVDSESLSTGIGHLVLDAAEMSEQGASAREIFETLERKKKRLDVSFVLNTLAYMRMGGRCSSVTALGANLLSLKPCIEVKNGKMGVGKKYRGQLDHCLQKYVADRLSDPESVDPERIFITDSGVSETIYEAVREEVLRHVPFAQVIHTRAGCTVSNHCGPDCLGILFYRKG